MIFQCVINAFGAFVAAFTLLLRIVFVGGINWRTSLETELLCCDVAQQTLMEFRRENRMRRILHFILNFIGLSGMIGYEEPSLSACNGPLQALVRNTLLGEQGTSPAEEVLLRMDEFVFLPKMFLFLTTIAITMFFFKGKKKIAGKTEQTLITDMEECTDWIEENDEDLTDRTVEDDGRELEEVDISELEIEDRKEVEEETKTELEEEAKTVLEDEEEPKEDILEPSVPELTIETSSRDHESENSKEESVNEVPLEEPRKEEENVSPKLNKEVKFVHGDLYEFPLSKTEKLILHKIGKEVREFTQFYNVRLDLPEDDTKEVAYLEGAENRVQMAFQHIQEILEEHEREGYNIDAEDLDSEEPNPPSEELVHEPESGLNFAAILKKCPPEKKKEKKQTFFIVQRKTFPIMEEWLEEDDEEEDMEFESDLETPEKDEWEFEEDEWEFEEDEWEFEEDRHKIIVGISLREAPEEDGQGGMRSRRLLKCVPRRLNILLPHHKEQEEAEEEKVPLQEKAEEPAKEEESDRQEENFEESEEQEETLGLTLKESVEENVLHEEKEENGPPPPPEDKANEPEGVEAKVQEESEKMSFANIAKILPVPKSAAPAENSMAKPTGPIKNPEVTRPAKGDNWKTTRPRRCGPLKQCGGKAFSFHCENDLDMGQIIGKGGKFAKLARQDHGVVMSVQNDGSRIVQLKGPKKNVEKVYNEIRFRVDKVFNISELTQVSKGLFAVGKEDFVMTVDQEFREAILGPQELTLRKLIREQNVAIYLPDQDDQRNYISIFGPLKQAQEAESVISKMIDDIQNFSAENDLKLVGLDWYQFDLGLEGRRLLLALNGQGAREVRNLFKVTLILPKEEDEREIGFLGGDLNQVKKAYDHLRLLLEEVSVRSCDITTEGLTRIGAGQYRLEVEAQNKGLLVGPKGDKLRKIEKYNNVKIIVHKKTDGFVTIQGQLKDVEDACLDIKEAMTPKGKNKTAQQGRMNFPQEEIVPGLTRIEDRLYGILLDREERAMVIGRGGHNIKRLVNEYKVVFQGPKVDETSNNCTVRGNEKDVVGFFNEVQEIIATKGQKRKFDGGQRTKRGVTLGDFL